ncbi:glycosyltransferase family 2 protein [Nodularia sp. NIES-3585]|uniref:glycosyltransferase family 2 protein n=1 Tax=Nodularia sp. NIES-3585 TaxID=1973477 RepID=UPI000B6C8A10|nr:glycosyltransferase family 2 protein [Nodularia sp. NIES-3585]GAX34322.1 family 2 glycosyl transferase [Nodularia sp. NIES-3585]
MNKINQEVETQRQYYVRTAEQSDNIHMNTCEITVVIPTYNRLPKLLETLEKILECNPRPNEIIIHIDGNDTITEQGLQNRKFPEIKIIKNHLQVGPGGGRNIAISHATNSIIASFDDDSYPIDTDYFYRLQVLFKNFPKAAAIAASIYHINETIIDDALTAKWVSDFVGCGCAYRKEIFQQTSGYVNLAVAYGMEEVDLSLRLHNMGWGVLESSWLRVFHNTTLEHHGNPKITASSIANQILLAYLRYPTQFWWLGIGQCINRIIWLIRHRRTAGIAEGVFAIPKLIRRHYQQRQVVSAKSLLSYLQLRKKAITVSLDIE